MRGADPVHRILQIGRVAYPEITTGAPALEPLIRQRLDGEEHVDRTALPFGSAAGRAQVPAVDHLDAAELYLACACATGDTAAIATFERRYFSAIPAALSRLSLGPDEIAEIKQVLRVRLLVGEAGEPARVIGYAGHGQLGGLVRIAAIR